MEYKETKSVDFDKFIVAKYSNTCLKLVQNPTL